MLNHGKNKNNNIPKQLFFKNNITKIYISHASRINGEII
jgi:hypothetical protein